MISLVALYPNHLNLNGDLANIKVLQRRLLWRGVDSSVSMIEKGDSLPDKPDFILIGHGSDAAWNDISTDLEKRFDKLNAFFNSGVAGLAVATGYEKLGELAKGSPLGLAIGADLKIERVSKFSVVELECKQALGYINSDSGLKPLTRYRNLLATLLHGPIFAKNEWLAEAAIASIFERRGEAVPAIQAKEKADQVADLIAKIWELEEPLAGE
jgi:CobQ-like glutamine amidotransferase family enzyme